MTSQDLLNANKILAKYRERDGVRYVSPGKKIERLELDIVTPQAAPIQPERPKFTPTIRIYPSLAITLLNHENRLNGGPVAAIGRLWLTLRATANERGGRVSYEDARQMITGKDSPLYLFGKRQFKKLLARGEGVFWTRAYNRQGELIIWLKSSVNVAEYFGLEQFSGKLSEIPTSKLTGSIGDFKAVLYAGWVAGRGDNANPITRDKKNELTGCSKYRQRSYEDKAGIQVSRNYAILAPFSDYNLQRARYHEGRAAFPFVDYMGKYGKPFKRYVAHHLPNSDTAPGWFDVIKSRRNRAFNRQLDTPCMIRHEGTGSDTVIERLFFEDGKTASKANEKTPSNDAYYQDSQGVNKYGQSYGLWNVHQGVTVC